MIPQNKLYTRLLSSLAKVFPDEEIKDQECGIGTMLQNEVFSFQVGYKWSGSLKKNTNIVIDSPLVNFLCIYKVGLVPSEMPCYADHDDNILRSTPGLYPDVLYQLDKGGIILLPEQWRSLWVEVVPVENIPVGSHPIIISFIDDTGELLGKAEFKLEVVSDSLPDQTLIYTNWFHCDCLSTWYDVEIFSEEHWIRIEQFIKTAVKHGMNMLLTPVFTPPLDTSIGGERPTVQLVEIEESGDTYKFKFGKLKRWFDLGLANGIKYFEISHLFTQWGARHAPKIMCNTSDGQKRLFGWDTDATDGKYKGFLSQFLMALVEFIRSEGLENKCMFHVSDEPALEHLDFYRNASSIINELLKDFPIIDALSNYEFYEKGLVKKPIPATDHIGSFLKHEVHGLWTYYCCGQYKKVSNRFFNMPSARNRILGYQLYKFNIEGFLQWGYNFWYTQNSLKAIDPYRVTDADCSFPSGDAFVVYPGEDGPVISLRLKVFFEALQDLRALNRLEQLIGRNKVIDIIDEGLDIPLTFDQYPIKAEWLLNKRQQINEIIKFYIS
jgi:hypothetical protein